MSYTTGISSRASRLGAGARIPTPAASQPSTVEKEIQPGPDQPLQPPTHLAVQNSESYWSPAKQGNMGTAGWKSKTKYLPGV